MKMLSLFNNVGKVSKLLKMQLPGQYLTPGWSSRHIGSFRLWLDHAKGILYSAQYTKKNGKGINFKIYDQSL